MSTNFNIVKKKKDDDEEDFMDEDEIEESESKSSGTFNQDAKKRMILFMGILLGGLLLLFLVLYIVSLFSHSTYQYEDIENVLKNAAIAYFKENDSYLPVNDGDIVEVDSSNLVATGKMRDLSEYTPDGVLCSATVQVEKSGTQYLYTPYLNCGDQYTTMDFSKKLTQDSNSIVTEGYGLYSMNGEYVFRGENVNNYVQLGDQLWRIVKISSNNNVVLIHNTGITYEIQPWDDRWNESTKYSSGFNQYKNSRIYEYLLNAYQSPSENASKLLLSDEDKAKIVSYNLCIGKRSANSEGFQNKEECAEVLPDQKYGLLTLSDYMAASVDPNCKNANSQSCLNYNYLVTKFDWWLATASKDDNTKAFLVDYGGKVSLTEANHFSIVRPVVYLNSRILYKSGSGTLEDPYILK